MLTNISFDIAPGETVAIVGETGCGKTTLANLLIGLESPKSGHIFIDGVDIEKVNKTALRSCISVVFQESGLLNATAMENITLGDTLYSREEAMIASQMALAHDFISFLPHQYDSPVGSGGMALSSGQRQRIAIARALLRDPAILVFDEATSNLDPETEQRLLQSFKSGRRRTTIFITHRLTTARHTDKIFVFQGGRITESGRHEELLSKKGRYHYMWTAFAGRKDEHLVSGESQLLNPLTAESQI